MAVMICSAIHLTGGCSVPGCDSSLCFPLRFFISSSIMSLSGPIIARSLEYR